MNIENEKKKKIDPCAACAFIIFHVDMMLTSEVNIFERKKFIYGISKYDLKTKDLIALKTKNLFYF